MNHPTTPWRLVIAALILLSAPQGTWCQKQWTWIDASGQTRTRTDLERIVRDKLGNLRFAQLLGANLRLWDLSGWDLSGADLTEADLSGADLTDADLSGADLTDADLSGADLSRADLRGAELGGGPYFSNPNFPGPPPMGPNHTDFRWTDLSRQISAGRTSPWAHFGKPNLSRAHVTTADVSKAFEVDLSGADLNEANLRWADLTEAHLSWADLTQADLVGADLSDADLSDADLSGAKLTDTELTHADCSRAVLQNALFESISTPNLRGIAAANGLESLTYDRNPDALVQLRKQFEENGFRTQEREITYSLNRRRAALDGSLERWFNWVAFDLTCQYGMSPGRPLRIWLMMSLFCWVTYCVSIHRAGESGIYRVKKAPRSLDTDEIEQQIRPGPIPPKPFLRHLPQRAYRHLRVAFWAGLFSLRSSLNIGFPEINLGRWLRLLTRTEYELKAKGWTRTVSGFQSLLSFYLIGLWALTYFGRLFE